MRDMDRKLTQSFDNLKRALKRLEEALQEDLENSLIVDGTIQRFEFTIELYWKTLKRLLAREGIDARTPRETLKEAYQVGWLTNEQAWLQMLKDRNSTLNVYSEDMACKIVHNISQYFPVMKTTFTKLEEQYITGHNADE